MPYPGTITRTNEHIFPDGTRKFSLRELARFQSFPDSHIFGRNVVKQSRPRNLMALILVANAVPPKMARRIFEKVVEKLRETDNVVVASRNGSSSTREVIELD